MGVTMVDLVDILCAVVIGLLMWAGHHVPWHIVRSAVGDDRQLHRPLAYAWGCGWILVALCVWAARRGTWEVAVYAALVTVAAGVGTLMPRLLGVLAEVGSLRQDRADLASTLERAVVQADVD